ncbi:hypothetical protein ACFL22_00895 [Patescibacteria group bacterium]
MCRKHARSRNIHLVNHELHDNEDPNQLRHKPLKRRKVSANLSASELKDLKATHRKNRDIRRDNAKLTYEKQCELEMRLANEQKIQNAVRYKRKPKKQLLVETPARKVDLQAIAERRERAEARKEMREFKKVFHFLLRISNGDKSLFVVLLASLSNNTDYHQEIYIGSTRDDIVPLFDIVCYTSQPYLSLAEEKALGRPRTQYVPVARRCSQRPRQSHC